MVTCISALSVLVIACVLLDDCLTWLYLLIREVCRVTQVSIVVELGGSNELLDEEIELIGVFSAVDYRPCVSSTGWSRTFGVWHDEVIGLDIGLLAHRFLEGWDVHLREWRILHVVRDEGVLLQLLHGDSVLLV